jgi:DUF4097 and DUF4098 domain-containing protein YvlB
MKSLVSLLLSAFVASAAYADVTEHFEHTYPLSAEGIVNLENVNGTVEITGWDRNEVSVVADKTAKTADDLTRIAITIDATSERFSVKTERAKTSFLKRTWKGQVYYHLKVPVRARLDKISVVNARLVIRDVSGPMTLETVNGDIDARGVTANGRFKSVNGSLSVSYAQIADVSEINFDTVNGSCTLITPAQAPLRIEGHSVNGGVHCDFPVTVEKSGHGNFRAHSGEGGPLVRFNGVNGSMTVKSKS